MFIDFVRIKVSAGHGGKGAVAFSKVMMSQGPTGGTGGKGGDVYLEAVADLGALRKYRTVKEFKAENGKDGRSAFRDGHRGDDVVLPVPRGTLVTNIITGAEYEFLAVGEKMLVVKGGWGGKGNFLFRSSKNTSPQRADSGIPGEETKLDLQLKLIADVGLVGLPNVGKSSFLNAMTNAKSPVADYAFTTLEPHLGAFYGLIIADLPGLIEGASSGKGLGIKFLRHIERTRVLFHFVSGESEHPVKDYEAVRAELGAYNKELLKKPEYIMVSKSDAVSVRRINESIRELKKASQAKKVIPFSIVDDEHIAEVKKVLHLLYEHITR